jgi:hypothetical protein
VTLTVRAALPSATTSRRAPVRCMRWLAGLAQDGAERDVEIAMPEVRYRLDGVGAMSARALGNACGGSPLAARSLAAPPSGAVRHTADSVASWPT